MPKFNTWEIFTKWLNNRGLFHMDLGLHRIAKALAALGLQKLNCPVIQVIGTNGKGSTCAFLESLALAHGLNPGVYTSPHFVSPTERIRINGKNMDQGELLEIAEEIFTILPELDFTWFEIITILAIAAFSRKKVDLAIMEAGLGGKNDATTALFADIICYTPIAMDHADIIGPAISDIARDKAAAIHSGCVVFSVPQFPPALKELQKRTTNLNMVDPQICAGWKSGLAGEHQLSNAALSLTAFRHLWKGSYEKEGIAYAFIPGRLQKIRHNGFEIILDGGHNPHAIKNLANQAPAIMKSNPEYVIFSCLRDKDWLSSIKILKKRFPDTKFLIVQMDNERAESAAKIHHECELTHPASKICSSVTQTLEIIGQHPGPTLLTGSFYLLGEFYKLFPTYLNPRN